MYILGILNGVTMLLCWFSLPNELNKGAGEDAEDAEVEAELENLDKDDGDLTGKKLKVTWGTVLKNRHFTWALITCFFGTNNLSYFLGYIGPYMAELGFAEENVGYIIATL